MLDLGQTFEEGLTFAGNGEQNLVLGEVPLGLLHVLALDSDRPEQAKGQSQHPGHAAEKPDLLGGEGFAGSGDQERSPGLLVYADGDCLAPTGTGDQDTGLLAAGRREYLCARMAPGPPARRFDAGLPQEGAGGGLERVREALKAVGERG